MPGLDVDALMAEARDRTGLHDFGDEAFREPLAVLTASLTHDANLNAEGLATQHARLVDSLATRLAAQDHFRRDPEILEERIEAPLVVVALPRSGTTHLHRLLASDPAVQAVLWWECRSPAPRPGSDWERGTDPRIADAHAQVKAILEARPELASIHPWDPEGPDEEILLLEHSFLSHVPESGANLPSYNAWLEKQDLAPAYAYLKKLLQFLQWQKRRAGRGGDRWVLKAPFHLGNLETLLAAFPDARVVQTHRDPIDTLPSIASMYAALWKLATDAVDEHAIGRLCLHRYGRALERCLAARERLPAERFLDVDYRALVADPIAEVRRIYAFSGHPLPDEVVAVMRRHLDDHARGKRASHDYHLERFGYDAPTLEKAFGAYRARFLSEGQSLPSSR